MLRNNLIALIVTFAVAILWLRLMDFLAHKGWISNRLSRKIIHIGTGPLFVLCWPLFVNNASARYLAALVPALITVQFILVGTGVIKDEAAVQAMTRNGNPREILQGPFYYGLTFVLLTSLYWYDTPLGIVALMLLSGGDGLADIIGRRFGALKIPWNPNKSWAGSAAMLLGGWVFAAVVLSIYTALGLLPGPSNIYVLGLTVTSFITMLIETLPFRDIDNITITLAALFVGRYFFH